MCWGKGDKSKFWWGSIQEQGCIQANMVINIGCQNNEQPNLVVPAKGETIAAGL